MWWARRLEGRGSSLVRLRRVLLDKGPRGRGEARMVQGDGIQGESWGVTRYHGGSADTRSMRRVRRAGEAKRREHCKALWKHG